MPFISEKFESYHDFALAELDEIYTPTAIETANKLEAAQLSSVLLINDGRGRFEVRELPRLAQASPGFGVVITDLDADGHNDIFMVHNFMSPQPETGQMDGGLSLLMRGDGAGNFAPVAPGTSGLLVPEQGMGLTVLDLNGDNWPDMVVSTNDGPVRAWENKQGGEGRPLRITLIGDTGNRVGVGARVLATHASGTVTAAEVHAGSGYLSQSSGDLFVGHTQSDPIKTLEIRWPDGKLQTEVVEEASTSIIVHRDAD